ncbi:hypothetical protein AGMMS4957_02420 [Bacteroidia bacterium]|nr:hypothetical protein AGMMS4957_02420 [Bacteroidia bacterium]
MSTEVKYMMDRYWSVFNRLDYEQKDAREAEVKSFSIEQINDRLCEIQKLGKEEYDGELYLLLEERKRNLDAAFEWTDENIAKFVKINQQMIDYRQKMLAKVKIIAKEAEERMSKDSFFEDMEVHARVIPQIAYWSEEDKVMYVVEDGVYGIFGMHELYDHTEWSLQDIIQINDFWCDIRVEYYYPKLEDEAAAK